VKSPIGYEELHGSSVVAGAEPDLAVEPVRLVQLFHIGLDPQAWSFRDLDRSLLDAQWSARESLPILPYPVGIDRSDSARRGSRDMGKHGE
jgi:hypothetical protein